MMEVAALVPAAMEDVMKPSPPPSPVAATKKLRRLRKVTEAEIAKNDGVGECDVVPEKVVTEVDEVLERRETVEEILKRFGKGGDVVGEGSNKRKTVQSTISTSVLSMALPRGATDMDVSGAKDDAALAHIGNPTLKDGETENGGLEHESQELERAAGSEELTEAVPFSKRKRSSTVKRCSSHVTGMTFGISVFEDEGDSMEKSDNASGKDIEVQLSDEEDSVPEKGHGVADEVMKDGAVEGDSEKGSEANEGGEYGGSCIGWSDGWSGEGMSMDSILEKARKMVADMSSAGTETAKPIVEKKKSIDVIDDQHGKKKKSKKEEERLKREDIYAESQRLLRESKGVAFVAPAPVKKSVSSVLEKIRQRRQQLGCSGSASLHKDETKEVSQRAIEDRNNTYVDLTVDEEADIEIEIFGSTTVRINKAIQSAEVDVDLQDDTAGDEKSPQAVESQGSLFQSELASSRSEEKDLTLELSQRIMNTQDLLCTSQLSPPTEASLETTSFEPVVAVDPDFMCLETQALDLDEDLMHRTMHANHQKETKQAGLQPLAQSEVYTTATHVRGLIDDEAEDEDEDILAENAEEEEEIIGDEEDLQDLIATTEKEKAGDKARRDALHRKWLDQQDTEQTEDILERLRTGRSTRWKGRDRVVSCLDEDDLLNTRESESLDNNSSQAGGIEPFAEEDPIAELSTSLRQKMKSQGLEMDCLDEYENAEEIPTEELAVEDDEDHEQSIIRKRMLEESEEQLAFMTPAEDESSREVLRLINKVNVGNLKTKSNPGHSEFRPLGGTHNSSLPSKPSFLGRSVSSSSLLPPAHRQVGSGGSSRSFVFGRDDSNSGSEFAPPQVQESKNTGNANNALAKGVSSTSTKDKIRPAQTTSGPSLFQMLKQQSKELEQNGKESASTIAKKWGSNTEAFSMFASKKSVNILGRK